MKDIEKIIEDVLREEPSFELSSNFKDRVLKTLKAKERRSQQKLFILMILGVFSFIALGAGALLYFQQLEILKNFKSIVPAAVMVGVAIAVIQYLDDKLVKNKLYFDKG